MIKFIKTHQKLIFYLTGILLLVVIHCSITPNNGDLKEFYGKILTPGSEFWPEGADNRAEALWQISLSNYLTWSSRTLIEAVMMVLGQLPFIVWHVLDILVILLIGYSLDELVSFKNENIKYPLLFVLLMMFPFGSMNSAGWVATTLNYTWPIACILYMFVVIRRVGRGKEKPASYLLAMAAAVFGMNQEQVCIFSLPVLAAICVQRWSRQKPIRRMLPFAVINVIMLIYELSCPGNFSRDDTEILEYAPELLTATIWDKIGIGMGTLLNSWYARGGILLSLTMFFFILYLIFFGYFTRTKRGICQSQSDHQGEMIDPVQNKDSVYSGNEEETTDFVQNKDTVCSKQGEESIDFVQRGEMVHVDAGEQSVCTDRSRWILWLGMAALLLLVISILGKGADHLPLFAESESGLSFVLAVVQMICLLLMGSLFVVYTYGHIEAIPLYAGFISGSATKVMLGFSVAYVMSGERTSAVLWFVKLVGLLYLVSWNERRICFLKKNWFIPLALTAGGILYIGQFWYFILGDRVI